MAKGSTFIPGSVHCLDKLWSDDVGRGMGFSHIFEDEMNCTLQYFLRLRASNAIMSGGRALRGPF